MSKVITKKILEILEVLPIREKFSVENFTGDDIPVYSSETQNQGVKGYCNKPQFIIDKNDYKRRQYIVFGDHTRSINIVNTDFNVMDNVKVLIPIYKEIDLTYVKYMWKDKIPNLGYSRHWKIAKNIEIEIPIDENGCFDLVKQKEIALKFQDVERKKETLLNKIDALNKYTVLINEDECNYKKINFNEMFKLERGKIISKPYILEHSGNFPVYSTQKGIYGHIDSYMKDGKFLLWNTDGLAGYIKITNGKFSYTNIVGIMVPTNVIDMNNISLEYLKIYLEPIFRANRKGRMGINGKNEYTKLNSTMIRQLNIQIPIPINENGDYDIEKQNELAQKYATIESIKQNLNTQVKELVSIIVN